MGQKFSKELYNTIMSMRSIMNRAAWPHMLSADAAMSMHAANKEQQV